MAETNENTTNLQQVPPTPQAPHTLSTIKLHILKKSEYDIWAMKMEHYLEHTNYPIWEFIRKGNGLVQVSTDTNGQIRVLPPKTAKEILARERERKARTTLRMAIPEHHLAKFHKMSDAKEMWEAIKSRFGGNDESKKMQKYLLKQQFESFLVSNSEGLHEGYDRFQSLLSQLETHGAGVSTKDANQKFLSGPQLDHEDLEQVDEFDLEEMDLKWQVAMISTRLKKFYKKTRRKLYFDAKKPVGFKKSKFKCFNYHYTGHFSRECKSKGNQDSRRKDAGNTRYKARDNGKRPAKQDEHKAMVTIDEEAIQAQTLRSSDVEDSPMNDKFSKVKGMHAVPPPMTGNYMPPKSDFGIDDSSKETLETMPKPVESKPKFINEPKVWSDAPIIKEYKSDSDDEYVSKASVEQEKPSCAFINTVKHVKTHRQTIQDQNTCSQNPKPSKRD
nr:ribonuclease H-like domain-containing protein [Tanacetum cinerariifolium]